MQCAGVSGPTGNGEYKLARTKSTPSWFRRLFELFWKTVAATFIFSILWVVLYRFVPPPITSLMIKDLFSGQSIQKDWTSLDQMAPHLAYAAIAAEDARFCQHHGFDVEAIEKAIHANARGRKLRGGSTISQQTAKNAFLWPQRSWLRKGLEAYFTVLIETLWPKKRIMEVYLNIAEWGNGIYGAEAASQHYFNRSAAEVTKAQAAQLVSILPSPKKWSPTKPSKRVKRKVRNVRKALPAVRNVMGACLTN